MQRIATFLAGAFASVALTSPAFAGDAECIWRALPQAEQAAVLVSVQQARAFDVDPDQHAGAIAKCVAMPASESKAYDLSLSATGALTFYALQLSSEAELKQSLAVDPAALDAAWRSVDGKHRRAIAASFDAGPKSLPDSTLAAMWGAMQRSSPKVQLASLAGKPELEQFMHYFLARAVREQRETEF